MKIIDAHTGMAVEPGCIYIIRSAIAGAPQSHTLSELLKQDKLDSGCDGPAAVSLIAGTTIATWKLIRWRRTGIFGAQALLEITRDRGASSEAIVPLVVRFMHPKYLFQWTAWVPS